MNTKPIFSNILIIFLLRITLTWTNTNLSCMTASTSFVSKALDDGSTNPAMHWGHFILPMFFNHSQFDDHGQLPQKLINASQALASDLFSIYFRTY